MAGKGDTKRPTDTKKFDKHFDQIYKRLYCASCQLTFNGFVDTRCEQCGGIPYELGPDNDDDLNNIIDTLKGKGC